jgi:hypothetical protein
MVAGTAVAWRGTALAQNATQLWGLLAIPGAGGRITLYTDGTPEATANPNAFHYGVTRSGAKHSIKPTYTKYGADEFRASLVTNVDALEMMIAAELLAVTDMDVVKNLLAGIGTYSTSSGYKQVTIGSLAIAYQCIASIFPLIEDTTKWGVFNIYSTINESGIEWEQSRKALGGMPVSFSGFEITTRAAADTLGNYWKQI